MTLFVDINDGQAWIVGRELVVKPIKFIELFAIYDISGNISILYG